MSPRRGARSTPRSHPGVKQTIPIAHCTRQNGAPYVRPASAYSVSSCCFAVRSRTAPIECLLLRPSLFLPPTLISVPIWPMYVVHDYTKPETATHYAANLTRNV